MQNKTTFALSDFVLLLICHICPQQKSKKVLSQFVLALTKNIDSLHGLLDHIGYPGETNTTHHNQCCLNYIAHSKVIWAFHGKFGVISAQLK